MVNKKIIILIFLFILAAVTLAVFYPVLHNNFTSWDDPIYVTENQQIKEFSGPRMLNIFTTFLSGNYHPLTLFFYSLEYHFFNLKPYYYHMTSLAIHLMNVMLVFWFIFVLSRNPTTAFVTTLLFAVHPTRVEPVAWIADQKDLLSALLLLGTLISYLYYRQSKRLSLMIVSLLLFAMSFLAKATGLMFPFILLCCDYFRNNRITGGDLKNKLPFLAVSILFGIIAVIARQSYQNMLLEHLLSGIDTFFLGVHRLVFYFLLRVLVPVHTTLLFPQPHLVFPSSLFVTSAILIVIFLGCLSIYFAGHSPVIPFGLFFFAAGLFPALSVVIIGHSADRFIYIPAIGIFFIFAAGFSRFYEFCPSLPSVTRIAAIGFLFLISASLGLFSRKECAYWKDGVAVWSRAIATYQNLALYWYNRGVDYDKLGKNLKAVNDFTSALNIDPNFYAGFNKRGRVYSRLDQFGRAIEDFTSAIRLKPDFPPAYLNRGYARAHNGDYNGAITDYSKVLQLEPNFVNAYINRGWTYYSMGNINRACYDLNRACTLGVCVVPQTCKSRPDLGGSGIRSRK